jgi:nickel-dependent lactate racemase
VFFDELHGLVEKNNQKLAWLKEKEKKREKKIKNEMNSKILTFGVNCLMKLVRAFFQ